MPTNFAIDNNAISAPRYAGTDPSPRVSLGIYKLGVNNLIQTPGNENFSTKRRKNWLRSTARGLIDFVLRTGSKANLWPRPQY